ncbi:MAG: membrane integrity-associated transporter subunit PqiC [Caulobacteraceae bacterium]|nr:membrane integrity-associated transporter subunit PqiC [Caulobacteraceae bacterium]
MIRRAVLALALPLALGGCISLFPKAPPAQLYTFGTVKPAATAAAPRFAVLNGAISFNRMAATDRILTVSGNEVAYIKSARWAEPAPLIFHEAEERAFDLAGGPARLVEVGEASRASNILRLNVLRFEARYDQGMNAAPTVVVRVAASLSKASDHSILGDQVFEAATPASENRVGAITQAFDQSTAQVLTQLVAWVGEKGA